MCVMEHFDDRFTERLLEALKEKPGLTRERLAAAMGIPYSDEFREQLYAAYDADLIHKVHDKYYPGSLKSY